VYGPQGIGCRTFIYLVESEEVSPFKQQSKRVIVQPDFDEDGNLYLVYETGEMVERYAKGSLGEVSGLNGVTAPLPNTLEEIRVLLRDVPPDKF